MVTVNVAVMDYCTCSIKMYSIEMKKGWQDEDVEFWLDEHTDYKDGHCYYMASGDDIEIEHPDVEE